MFLCCNLVVIRFSSLATAERSRSSQVIDWEIRLLLSDTFSPTITSLRTQHLIHYVIVIQIVTFALLDYLGSKFKS